MWAVAILDLARTRRFAMVASGTKKARAMASTSRRASVRKAKATWASRLRAGWQQVKIRRSMSSRGSLSVSIASITSSISSFAPSVPHRNAAVSLSGLSDSRLKRSSALRRATTVSQARGFSGIPDPGHVPRAAIVASERASSATDRSPNWLTSVASTLGPCSLSTLTRASPESTAGRLGVVWRDRAELDLAPPSGWNLERPGDRLVKIGRLQHEVAGQDFFCLRVRTVCQHHVAAPAARNGDGGRHGHRVKRLTAAHHPRFGGPPGELRIFGRELGLGGLVPVPVAVVVTQSHVQRHRQNFLPLLRGHLSSIRRSGLCQEDRAFLRSPFATETESGQPSGTSRLPPELEKPPRTRSLVRGAVVVRRDKPAAIALGQHPRGPDHALARHGILSGKNDPALADHDGRGLVGEPDVLGLVDNVRSLERARERIGHGALDLFPVLLVDAGLDDAGVVEVVGHERLGVVRLPPFVHAFENGENRLLIFP